MAASKPSSHLFLDVQQSLLGRSCKHGLYLAASACCRQTPEERELSALARAALEKAVLLDSFPKAIVDVYACVLEAGDSPLQA